MADMADTGFGVREQDVKSRRHILLSGMDFPLNAYSPFGLYHFQIFDFVLFNYFWLINIFLTSQNQII